MDTLKKALRRTDQRRVSNGMEGTRNYKETRAPWIDVDDLIAKKAAGTQGSLHYVFRALVEANICNGVITSVDKLNQELCEYYEQQHPQCSTVQNQILVVLEQMARDQQSLVLKKLLLTARDRILELTETRAREKKQKMKEYDKLFYRKLPPSSHLEDSQNSSSSNRIFLKQCLSANELTHFGREATGENQRMTCDEEERVGQETRLDKRWKGKSSASQKNLPRHKLQLFLKETNCRAAANKVKYEYSTSAILEASKRKVQKRSHNATACEANIPEKEPLAKVGRRKDQGFVFYRPEKKKLLIV